VADELPVTPAAVPAPEPVDSPVETPEPPPLDQSSLSDFVKRRAKGETPSAAPAEEVDGEQPTESEEKIPGKPGRAVPKTRFDQVYRQRSEALRERDAATARTTQLELEIAQLRQRVPPEQPAQPQQPAPTSPNLDQYLAAGKTYEEWMDARIEWQAQRIADARIEAVQQRYQQQTVAEQRQQEIAGLGERTEVAKQKYPDYEEKVIQNNEVRLSPVMAEIAARSPHGTDIMYWLGTHKAEADQLGELTRNYGPASYPLVEQHLLLLSGQVPQSTGAKKAVPVSKAPAPISPVGGGSSTTTVPLDQMSLGDFVKRRNADQNKRTG
jgi:hypothetical protein